jgi:phosphodiesterase/alkaline phosphatase D-like protein
MGLARYAVIVRRREFLHAIGAGGLAAMACRGEKRVHAGSDGAAVFEPSQTGLLVSVWSSSGSRVVIEVIGGAELVASRELEFQPSGIATADLAGLAPDTEYRVEITIDGAVRLVHRARTAPADDAARSVRIAVSADWDPLVPEFHSDLAAHVVAAAPELYVSLGDFPYTDDGPIAVGIDEYRQRHAALRVDPRSRDLLQAMAVRAIYDDHEFRNDWDAGLVAAEPARYAAALQAWDEFFPLRAAPPEIRYRSWRWGAHVECFLLDCRRFRSRNAAVDGPTKTMLGDRQLAWLLDGLARSTAPFKLVFTSIPLDFGNGIDHWVAYQHERQLIFDALARRAIPGVLFVSGDQHWFAAHRHAYGIREFQIGPVARGLGFPMEPAPEGVLFRAVRYNAGIIDVTRDALTFTGLGAGGERFYAETVTPEQLRARV